MKTSIISEQIAKFAISTGAESVAMYSFEMISKRKAFSILQLYKILIIFSIFNKFFDFNEFFKNQQKIYRDQRVQKCGHIRHLFDDFLDNFAEALEQ